MSAYFEYVLKELDLRGKVILDVAVGGGNVRDKCRQCKGFQDGRNRINLTIKWLANRLLEIRLAGFFLFDKVVHCK